MKGKPEEKKMDFILDLACMQSYTDGPQWQTIRDYLLGYMFPRNDDGELDALLWK